MNRGSLIIIGYLTAMVASACTSTTSQGTARVPGTDYGQAATATPEPTPDVSGRPPGIETLGQMRQRALQEAMKSRSFDPTLEGRELYLCCNLRFNRDADASDANYAYPEAGTTLRLGTRVRIVKVGRRDIEFQAEGDTETYSLDLRFGRSVVGPAEYFRNILRETDPSVGLLTMPPLLADAISQGKLVAGMTKDQALMARGYPPFHQTPGIEGNEWIYYHTRGFIDRVRFIDGKIQSVVRGPAP